MIRPRDRPGWPVRKMPWEGAWYCHRIGAWLAFQVKWPERIHIYLRHPPTNSSPRKSFPELKASYGKDGNKRGIHKLLLWSKHPVLESSDKPPSRVWLRSDLGGNAQDCRDWEPVSGKKFPDRGHERSNPPCPSPNPFTFLSKCR